MGNLKQLQVHAEVTRILWDGRKATGVNYTVGGKHVLATLRPKGRILSAAGALNSPRLLLRSGIKNDAMGRSLTDHTVSWRTYKIPTSFGLRRYSYRPPDDASLAGVLGSEKGGRIGGLTQYGPLLVAYFRDPRHSKGWDVELFVNPATEDGTLRVYFFLMRPNCSSADLTLAEDGWNLAIKQGTNRLHLACAVDREIVQSAADATTKALETALGAQLLENTPVNADIGNHWAGTCALGSCADPKTLAIRGSAENVHIVDASLLPRPVTGHPWFTIAAVATKAAERIAALWLGDQNKNAVGGGVALDNGAVTKTKLYV